MAAIRADGNEVPLVFLLDIDGRAIVYSHLLHVRFKFVESSIFVEEERWSSEGHLEKLVPVQKLLSNEGHCWHLGPGDYRACGLPLHIVVPSVEIGSGQFGNSTVNRPFLSDSYPPSPHQERCLKSPQIALLIQVKVESLKPIVELFSGSEGQSPSLIPIEDPIAVKEDTSTETLVQSHQIFHQSSSGHLPFSDVVI